jgi:hypothetical protein
MEKSGSKGAIQAMVKRIGLPTVTRNRLTETIEK